MNIIPNYLRMQSQLQNLIDQAPSAFAAREAMELATGQCHCKECMGKLHDAESQNENLKDEVAE